MVYFDVGVLIDCVLEMVWFKFYIIGILVWIIVVNLFKVVLGVFVLLSELWLSLELVGMWLDLLVLLDKLVVELLVIMVVV